MAASTPDSVDPTVLTEVERRRCFGGWQVVVEHDSAVLDCRMKLAVFLPPQAGPRPALMFLSGLTCTEQNVITKAGAQRACAQRGLVLVCPDTSPRGERVADNTPWDIGQGAGFYLTATRQPWSWHYRMDQYVLDEVPQVVATLVEVTSWGITGHSMGGHGALTLALRNPGRFASVSAMSPILEPSHVPWGRKAFQTYLGQDPAAWAAYDATMLIPGATERLPLLIDQGDADPFLEEQLTSARFRAACDAAGHPLEYRLQPGYDHSYYFVASFIDDHVAWAADAADALAG